MVSVPDVCYSCTSSVFRGVRRTSSSTGGSTASTGRAYSRAECEPHSCPRYAAQPFSSLYFLLVVLWTLIQAAVRHGGVRVTRARLESDQSSRGEGHLPLRRSSFTLAGPDSVSRLCFSVLCRCVARRTRTTSTSTPTRRKRRRSRATRKGTPSSTSRSLRRFLEAFPPERPWPVPAADGRAGRQPARGGGGTGWGVSPTVAHRRVQTGCVARGEGRLGGGGKGQEPMIRPHKGLELWGRRRVP